MVFSVLVLALNETTIILTQATIYGKARTNASQQFRVVIHKPITKTEAKTLHMNLDSPPPPPPPCPRCLSSCAARFDISVYRVLLQRDIDEVHALTETYEKATQELEADIKWLEECREPQWAHAVEEEAQKKELLQRRTVSDVSGMRLYTLLSYISTSSL